MALYAFDGTSNKDEIESGKDSNVVKFVELYPGKPEYLSGVGTRGGTLGYILGGLFGAGGKNRINEMYEKLCENYSNGDKVIDIIGFSRGAALAVHFANKLSEDQIQLSNGSKVPAKVRFLGLWDVVASFGLSFNNIVDFQEIDLGWDVDSIADCVEKCYHAMALDERRESFNVKRLDSENQFNHIVEVWFRGVHSDIGGSNENPLRSNIALNWMLDNAREAGININEEKAKEEKYSSMDICAPVMQNSDVFIDPRRETKEGDSYHDTACPVLEKDESITVKVVAERKYNWSGIKVEKGAKYRFEAKGTWLDNEIKCDADGWETGLLGWGNETIFRTFEDNRRCPEANWFELIGAYGDNDKNLFRLGKAVIYEEVVAKETAPLWFFANDLSLMYFNNSGEISVTITRVEA